MSEENRDDKLYFAKSDRFFREVATDVVVSGPILDDMYHLSCLLDNIDLPHQTIKQVNKDDPSQGFSVHWEPDDTKITDSNPEKVD